MSKHKIIVGTSHRADLHMNGEIARLKRQLEWFENFAKIVQGDNRTYNSACEYADELEVEKYGADYSGNYSSVNDFINYFDLENKANELFGESWEAENDIEQIQMLVGDEYIVKAIKPTNKREERIDDYIIVSKVEE